VRVFGLTGGIASGKSVVARIFREHGVPVVDADEVAREVVERGTPGLAKIVEEFGPGVLASDGTLDRKALGAVVFDDANKRALLNAILHPAIAAKSAEHFARLGESNPLVCYDAALIVERGLADMFRPLVVVAAPLAVQRARLQSRDGLSASEADARLAAQAPVEAKIAAGDIVIHNDDTLETLNERALSALADVKRRVSGA
jgi:dephospho-CoA kinase